MTINKISKGIGILRAMRHLLQENQLKDLYSYFIKRFTECGNLAWGGGSSKNQPTKDRKKSEKGNNNYDVQR